MENSEENKSKEKKSYFIHWLLGGAVGVFIGVTLLFFYINKWTLPVVNDENNTLSNLGTIGDYFGGLINPLLGFVSFCSLLYTIHIQREELGMTKKELARSADAQEQSSAILKKQQFESTFFSLLDQIIVRIDRFHEYKITKSKMGSSWHEAIEFFSTYESLKSATEGMCVYDWRLSQIFSLIYQLLKLIDRYEIELSKDVKTSGNKTVEIAKTYSNILRSCLDENLLKLFAINGCRNDLNNMQMYKEYIERYALLEHISFIFHSNHGNGDYLKEIVGIYAPKAFGENKAYKEIKKAFDLNELIKRIDVASGLSEKDINDAKEIIRL